MFEVRPFRFAKAELLVEVAQSERRADARGVSRPTLRDRLQHPFHQLFSGAVAAPQRTRQHLVDGDFRIFGVAGLQACVGQDRHGPRHVLDGEDVQRVLVAAIGVKTDVRLLDHEDRTARPQDQIQLACRKLLEVQRFPVHHVPQR